MPAPGPVRNSQRSVLACTACVRRKIRCSKTIPCETCIRQNKASSCRREQVAVVTRRGASRRTRPTNGTASPSALSEDTSVSPDTAKEHSLPFTTPAPDPATIQASVVGASIEPVVSSAVVPPPSREPPGVFDNAIQEITNQKLIQILTSAHTADSRLTNEAAAALEFLAHGRRNVLNRFSGKESVPQSTPTFSSRHDHGEQWDPFFSPEDARMLLALHQAHLTWMHNVVNLPTFRQEFDNNLMQMECDCSWLALYYALLSQTVYHINSGYLASLPQPIHADMKTSRLLFDKSIEVLFKGGFMDEHKLTSVQAICLLMQVAHNFDKSDLICVLISTAIRISQCLNLHRLGADRPGTTSVKGDVQNVIDREVRKRVWWFLVRYDWLQIPFQNTCQIHLAQFNTPMPANAFDDPERMIQNGAIVSQPDDVCTSSSWTNCLNQLAVLVWKHQDRVFGVGYPGEDPDRILKLYDQAIRADREIKDLYSSWPLALREVEDIQLDQPMLNSFPIGLMPGMVLICTAHKLSCIAIAERSIESIRRWPDTLESRISRRMWTTLTHVVSCCITLVLALLFKSENALTYDSTKIRQYIEFGKDFISQEGQFSSIARRGVKLLTALMNLEDCSDHSLDIEADIGDIVRRVATTDDGSLELSAAEAHQVVFPGTIVTGGSRGIGRAIAIHSARKGLEKLAITYASNSAAAQVTLEECRRLGVGQTVAIQADVLDPQFGPVVVDQALQGLGTSTIDILVNNAVITDPSIAQSFADTTIDVFTKVMQGNVFAAMSITNAVLAHLPEHGGRVINISSMSAKAGNPDPIITYGASKAALDSVTRSLAKTFALSKGATFTSVTVGLTETDAYATAKQNFPPEHS
ncbi:hypothetical protein FDECE_2210 [Fusarium decemcellulare]|nr:hypothetical protein FDECE_2210 [Fusarium decemcellulare]